MISRILTNTNAFNKTYKYLSGAKALMELDSFYLYLRCIINDSVESVQQVFGRHGVDVEDDSSSFASHVVEIIRLISKQW